MGSLVKKFNATHILILLVKKNSNQYFPRRLKVMPRFSIGESPKCYWKVFQRGNERLGVENLDPEAAVMKVLISAIVAILAISVGVFLAYQGHFGEKHVPFHVL